MATCQMYRSDSLGRKTLKPSTGSLCSAFSSRDRWRMEGLAMATDGRENVGPKCHYTVVGWICRCGGEGGGGRGEGGIRGSAMYLTHRVTQEN